MCDCIVDPGRSNYKYEDYINRCSPCFSSAHNFRIILMWSNENGIKNRFDFPVRKVSYDGNRYKVFLTTYLVMHNLRVKINTLEGQNTQYGLYLSYEDYYNKTTYTPMKIVNFAKRTYLLPPSQFSLDDCYVTMEVYIDQFTKFIAELFYEMTKDTSIYYDDHNIQRSSHIWYNKDPYAISQIWYNNPYTTIKWSDNSVTTSKCSSTETFSKEVGVAMCISKKYMECRGSESPRKGFKSLVDSGVDLKEIHDKRNRKKALKRAIDMARAGYSMKDIKKTLNLTDDDVLDLFKDESPKE